MSRGKKTSVTGNQLEKTVVSVLTGKGFKVVPYRLWIKNKTDYGDELLLTNVPFETIYRHKGKTEFLLLSKKYNLEVRIECKWQQTSGSVDEKLPYLYLNAIEAMPEKTVMILIDGRGWKAGAIQWLRKVVDERKYVRSEISGKEIMVVDLTGFLTWANDVFS